MADGDLNIFSYEYMTGIVQQFRFPQFWFVNQVPDEPIDGTIARWDIEQPQIEIDTNFTVQSGEAQPVKMGTYKTRTQRMPITFKFNALDPGVLSQLRELGQTGNASRARNGRSYVMREQMSMQRRFGSYLDEYLLSKALTGSLTLSVGGVSQTIDYGIPAGNKPTAGVSWATATTDIPTDLTNWKRLIVKATGMTPRWAVCNQTVMNYVMKNDNCRELMGQTAAGVQIAENGYLTRFHGLNWVVLDHHYAASGSSTSFNTPFIADDKLFLLPDISSEWISMQRGTCVVPNQGLTDVMESMGPVMWSRVSDSPTGLVLYYKNARLPAIKIPSAVVYAETTP